MTLPVANRLRNLFGFARTTLVKDDAEGHQRQQVKWNEHEMRDDTVALLAYGFVSNPHPGADALTVSVAGERSATVVIATGDARYRLKGLKGGEVAIHDDLGHVVKLGRNGIEIKGGGHNLAITGCPKVTVAGDIEATGDIKAGTVSLKQHRHTAVQTGTAISGVPQQ